MRSWRHLFAVCSLALLTATPALATSRDHAPAKPRTLIEVVLACGFSNTALGQCALSSSCPDHSCVSLSNVSNSGLDGMSIALSHLDGVSTHLTSSVSDADNGASCSLNYLWVVDAMPPTVACRSSFAVLLGHDELSCDFPASTRTTATVTLMLADAVVASSTQPLVPRIRLTTVPVASSSSREVPTLYCSSNHLKHSLTSTFTFAAPHLTKFDGLDIECDRVIISCDVDGDGFGDRGQLYVTNPPGGSLSSVTVDHISGRLNDHYLLGLHGASLTCASGYCSVDNLDGSGEGGLALEREASAPSVSEITVSRMMMASPSLSFDPVADAGATFVCRINGGGSCSPDGRLASLSATMQGSSMLLQSSFSGMCADAESVIVVNAGQRGPRQSVSLDGSFVVQAPPGGPPAMMMSSVGGSRAGWDLAKGKGVAPQTGVRPVGEDGVTSSSASDGVTLQIAFRSPRVFVFGGHSFTGDELLLHGSCSSGCGGGGGAGGAVITVVGQSFSMASSGSSSGKSSFQFSSLQSVGSDLVFADVPSSAALSSSHSSVTVPVVIKRSVPTPMRAYSVTFHVSSLLQLSAPVLEGDYLSSGNPTQFFVLDNGGGSFTVDCAILSSSCTATGGGTLFTLQLAGVQPPATGTGAITIDRVIARDCSNAPITLSAGDPGLIPVDFSQPPALTGLSAVQQRTGNDLDGTTKIVLTCPSLSSTSTMEVYRAPFGNYPRYDNSPNAGAVPSPPSSYPPGEPWTLSSVHVSGDLDEPLQRDYYYYCAFARDVFGNVSPVSNRTAGTLDYHLGDFSNGLAVCTGDNRVGTADVSVFGAHYGQSVTAASSFACLDVGPTLDFSPLTRPTTDGKLDFEDLVVVSMNYSVVSAPAMTLRPAAAASNALHLVAPALPGVGETYDVTLGYDGAGDVRALSAQLDYDHSVLEPVAVSSGTLLGAQGRDFTVLSSAPGDLDAALLGDGPGIAGTGELARVTFRVKAAGDPRLSIANVIARDGENRAVAVVAGVDGGSLASGTSFGVAYPNPFVASTTVELSLRDTGPVSVGVYDVAGRRVRTLLQGRQAAGTRAVSWDGRDDAGVRLSAGVYLVRLDAAARRETRLVRLLK